MKPPSPPLSPCTGVCRLDARDTCIGCGRLIDEIIEWPSADQQRRNEIAAAATQRLVQMRGTPGSGGAP